MVIKWNLKSETICTSLFGQCCEEKGAAFLSEFFLRTATVRKTASQWVLILQCLQKRASGWLSRYRNSLLGGRSGHRIPVGASYSAPVLTGLGTHPASHTMRTGSLLGVKRSRHDVNHSPHLALRLMKKLIHNVNPPPTRCLLCRF